MRNKIIQLINIIILFIIIIMGGIAIIVQATASTQSVLSESGVSIFRFFTIDGNIFIVLSSIFILIYFIYASIYNKDIPNYVYILHLMNVVSSVLIFLTVMVVLVPYYGTVILKGYIMLVLHVTNPILVILSFLFLYNNKISKKLSILGIIPMAVYGITAIILVVTKVWTGNLIPYPFLRLYENPWWQSFLYITSMFGGCIGVSILFSIITPKLYLSNFIK